MKNRLIIGFVTLVALVGGAAIFAQPISQDDMFIKGLDGSISYCPSRDGDGGRTFGFSSGGQEFKASALWYKGGTIVTIEGDNSRPDILFANGKITKKSVAPYTYPAIGLVHGNDDRDNEFVIGAHDFTNDNSPELVVAEREPVGDGIAIFVFQFDGSSWSPIGEIVTRGKGLSSPRIFRQAITLRGSGGLYTWTYHGSKFDFVASDGSSSPELLF
jgi:hypothetical protein